jgi:hypothetical protein
MRRDKQRLPQKTDLTIIPEGQKVACLSHKIKRKEI